MTIKPVGSQKSVDGGKKDAHGHVQVVAGESSNQSVVRAHRSVVIDNHAQSPQRRSEVFEEISRHRRSPHRTNRSKREHHKREREREKPQLTNQNCNSPHHTAFTPTLGNKSPAEASPLATTTAQSPSPTAQVTANLLKAVEDAYSGYNSGDEHLRPTEAVITAEEWKHRDEQFDKMMSERGFILKNIEEDGACLFRAISLQIYGDEEMHDHIRQQTMDYIYQNREYFSHFVTEDINSYIKRKRKKDSHGNHIEIQAMSEIYNRPVELYCYKSTPINIFNSEQLNKGYPPLRLSYQRGSHYNAIIDPYNASVGVGLGLAGYKPELQTREALLLSEQLEIEQTMFEDKLKTTDWEATNEAIEEQIARESYLQWCRENMQKARMSETAANPNSNQASGSGAATGSTSATVTSAEAAIASPSKYHQHQLRNATCTVTNENLNSSTSSTSSVNLKSPATTSSASAAASPSGAQPTNSNAPTTTLNIGNMSPKSLTAFAQSLRKDSELCFDSDDTDMSSTSSIDHPSGDKLASRGKKSKNRGSNSRLSKRRRREIGVSSTTQQPDDKDNENENLMNTSNKPQPSVYCDSECKRSRPSTPETHITPTPALPSPQQTQLPPLSPSSSSSASSSPGTSKQVAAAEKDATKSNEPATIAAQSASASPATEANQPPVSSFYQSLLESSYAADGMFNGFAQLSESEMLQQAIQISTQEYLEDQKRKGGYYF